MQTHLLHPYNVSTTAFIHAFTASVVCCAAAGCTPFAAAQQNLLEQARRGVVLTQTHQQLLEGELARHQAAQALALGNAFDDDVRARAIQPDTPLTAEWVIAHRQGYAIALTALARRNAQLADANSNFAANLAATRLALDRLSTLIAAQSKWTELFTNPRSELTEQP